MRVRLALSLLFVVGALCVTAAAASAAPVPYTVYLGNNQSSTLSLDGDQLTALTLTAFIPKCEDGNTDSMHAGLPATATSVSGNALHVETDGDLGYPDSGAHVVLDGTVSGDRRSIAGTITFSGMHSVFTSGCPPVTTKFYAVRDPATVAPDPEHQWTLTGAHMKVDATPGHIARLTAGVPLACGNAVNYVDFDTRAYGIDDLAVSPAGTFSTTLYVLDEYEIPRVLTITGTITATDMSARFQVANTDVADNFLVNCVGDATFSAGVPAVAGTPAGSGDPAVPLTRLPSSTLTNTKAPPSATVGHQTLPRRSGPSAVFDWAELRISRGAAYSYYFLVDGLRCLNHATHVRIVALGHAHRVACGRRRGFASGPLPAGTDYRLTAQALRIRRGRIVGRGSVVMTLLHMRAADYGWVPITNLPGTPPKI
jgi:hypothetical protein